MGANTAITQYFFDPNAYYQFVESCKQQNIHIPIIPGIILISDYDKLSRFSKRCGAEIPAWLDKRLRSYNNDKEAIVAYGIEIITQLCKDSLNFGVDRLHFYILNQSEPVASILNNLHILS